ncbi:MAG: carbamoyl phosphate synthase large subunit [Candidatus Altiarchaeales archaeon ex4484_96]|nr:MAG: carbamoyl phosphate synthase large subunit [Candidatus Altiarchaeales archaeon ex4484_96]
MEKILIIGSGPIKIGQAAEFDYSGSQACLSIREEGIKTILINSNPATIMTEPDIADIIYVEPLIPEVVAKIIEKENPDGILPTMGGQTALNIASSLSAMGVLEEHNVKMLGTPIETIKKGEDRESFAQLMKDMGEPIPDSKAVNNLKQAHEAVEEIGYPVIIRPAYTLGGGGGGIALNKEEVEKVTTHGLQLSMINQVLIEKSIAGWIEIEYEVMRDTANNCITICNMENLDPMGIHTGESIVVAPAQTLSDQVNQTLKQASLKIIRALGVEGGCNIQFALEPETMEYMVIEVNPRVSRSSALASKATGYPIARIAAKIALGKNLDEIPNSITKTTPSSFEPSIDYIVVKIPRWPFDKFRNCDRTIGTQMKSTGEVMSIGRTFEEALQKAVRSLDIGRDSLQGVGETNHRIIDSKLNTANDERLYYIIDAIKQGYSNQRICELSQIHPWFIQKIRNITDTNKTTLAF